MLAIAFLGTGCSTATPSPSGASVAATPTRTPRATRTSAPSVSAQPTPTSSSEPNVYAAVDEGLSASVATLAPRVYVPDEHDGEVVVIDPTTFKVVGRLRTGVYPEHVTPDWDLTKLYVCNMSSSVLTVLDPKTAHPTGIVRVPTPYNVYFTPDGSTAVVVNDYISPQLIRLNGLYFYDRKTWRKLGWVEIPWPGADDLDFSADGAYLMVSAEYSGIVAKVDVRSMKVTGSVRVGGLPRDVRLAPNGKLFLATNESLKGVSVIDPHTMQVVKFIKTGAGAHGLEFGHDAKRLYVNNRSAGTISVVDVGTLRVVSTWDVGGSPDEMVLSPDGSQLWVSNRYNASVTVVDTHTGRVVRTIATGNDPHGLLYWPLPGRFATGQNGNMR